MREPTPFSNSLARSSFSAANSPMRTSRARAVGLGDGEIVETIANIALNIFENYMSPVAGMPIDFAQSQSRETSD